MAATPRKTRQSPTPSASPQRVVQNAIQSRTFAPVWFLHGDDDFLKDAAVTALVDAAIDPSTRDFNFETRRGNELDAETIASLLATPPMLAERRALVIRDVGLLKKAARAQLDLYLKRPAPDTLLLLVNPAGAKADAALEKSTENLHFEPLTPERVRRWIAHHASTVHSLEVSEEATVLLQRGVGNDLHLLSSELDKCASYLMGFKEANGDTDTPDSDTPATITADIVSAVVGVQRGETLTDLIDAVAHRDAPKAVSLVEHILLQPKVTAVQVVIFLGSQALALSYGRARRDAGVPLNRLSGEYFGFLKSTGVFPGRPWGEAASLWTKVIDLWPAADCEEALKLLLEADIALKETTVSRPDQIVLSLVLALCTPGARRRKAA